MLTYPIHPLHLKFKTNILSNIHDNCFKSVTYRVSTKFSFDLADDLVFDPSDPVLTLT